MEEKKPVRLAIPGAVNPRWVRRGSCGGSSPLPEGMQWKPHTGARQRLRVLKRTWKRWTKRKKSPAEEDAMGRLLDAIAENINPAEEEVAAMIGVHAAMIKSEETGKPIEEFLDRAASELKNQLRPSGKWNAEAPA